MGRTKWTPKEIRDIWAKGIKCWPNPGQDVRYGASDDFLPVLINNWDVRERFCEPEAYENIQSEFIHGGIPSHRFVGDLLWGGTGCHGLDTPILMYDKSIRVVQDIKVGDQIMGPDYGPRNVISLKRGRGQLYKVTPENEKPFICDSKHILSLRAEWDLKPRNISITTFVKCPLWTKWILKLYKTFPNGKRELLDFKIEELERGDYFGFEIDGDQLYLLDTLIVSHNSGKTSHSVGLGMEYTFLYPGTKGLVGGAVYGDLRANVISQWQSLLSIRAPFDHPCVKCSPSLTSAHCKELKIEPYPGAIWSEIEFFQVLDWERVRGRNKDWMHLEEISQFLDSSIIDEAPRRLRGTILPVSHLFCTTNPPESTSHWIYPKWNVNQYLTSWEGKPKTPIGNPCTCQFCQKCLNAKPSLGEWPWDENHTCTNPDCAFIKVTGKRARRDFYKIKDKHGVDHDLVCPGNQYYWRLMFSDAASNAHIRADYLQTIVGSSDSNVAALYARGTPMELNSNNAYNSFSLLNINTIDVEFDPSKDLHLCLDFNKRPACSCVVQETLDSRGEIVRIDCIDEIILFDIREILEKFGPNMTKEEFKRNRGAGPEHTAEYLMKKFPDFRKTVYLWGDPTATTKNTSPLEKTKFQIIHDILDKAGYKVKMMVDQSNERSIPLLDRLNNANWLFKDNTNHITCYINKKCEYTVTSIRDIKLDKSGQRLDKANIDEYARRTTKVIYPEDVYKSVQFVSHPGDGLTYYLYQRLPIIKKIDRNLFFSVPGETSYKLQNNNLVETKYKSEEEKKKDNPILYIAEDENNPSFLDQLQGMGASFDDENQLDENFFRGFYD